MTNPIRPDAFDSYFGLSYNPYLVVPRSILESMPLAWQQEMVKMLRKMEITPAGQRWVEAHYFVRRTDPERDAEIHEACLHNQTSEDDNRVAVPDPLYIADPFRNYRHPDRRLFVPDEEPKP